jgi:YD repeat-containing protein
LQRVSGARTYTVDYTYTAQGRLETLVTAGGTTTWEYGAETGLIERKILPDGTDIDYTYTGGGRVRTRTTQRGIVTTYGYNAAGQIATIDYSDATPDVSYGYNRLGQLETVVRDASTHVLQQNEFGQLLEESITGGILDGVAVAPGYDGLRSEPEKSAVPARMPARRPTKRTPSDVSVFRSRVSRVSDPVSWRDGSARARAMSSISS